MTMSIVFEEERAESIRAVLPDWVPVFKFVDRAFKSMTDIGPSRQEYDWASLYFDVGTSVEDWRNPTHLIPHYRFGAGLQVANFPTICNCKPKKHAEYLMGFHFYTTNAVSTFSALTWMSQLKCYIHKSWITSIGRECRRLVFVSPFAVFPKYPEKEVRLEDIKKVLESQNVQASQRHSAVLANEPA